MMKIISGLALLTFGLLAPAQTPQANHNPTIPPPPGVWAKLDEDLSTIFTRAGDKISVVLQENVTVKDVKLPKGTKLTGSVLTCANQDKVHPHSGFILLFDKALLKDGTALPVKVTMTSLAPSHSDEVEQIFAGSGQVTDAAWHAAAEMGILADSNESQTGHSATNLNGHIMTSSIKGVALFASATGKSSGVVVAIDGPLQLTKWTRINLLVTSQ
jgi:hypothetical protein